MPIWGPIVLAVCGCLYVGCDSHVSRSNANLAERSAIDDAPPRKRNAETVGRPRLPQRRGVRESISARAGVTATRRNMLSHAAATERMLAIVQEYCDDVPTLVVWLLDVSPSAMAWASDVRSDICQFYQPTGSRVTAKQLAQLETGVWTFGSSVEQLILRSNKPDDIVQAIANVSVDSSGREVTFEAVDQVLQEYLSVRLHEQREVVVVIVTDEAGDDWQRVDQLVDVPRKYAVPVYVIGVPAPFGRLAAIDDRVELKALSEIDAGSQPSKDVDWLPILQGSESRELERIDLAFEEDGFHVTWDLIDSGFGPYGLERLCRASGGGYLAVRATALTGSTLSDRRVTWPPADLVSFDPDVMYRYLPEPMNADQYQKAVADNRALQALRQAAQLPRTDVLQNPQLIFVKRSEADLKNQLDKAQQAAARVAPDVDQMYELLREGVVEADQLRSRRWQAGFLLAFGRVSATKARIDGYNSMLALLKRGKSFERDDSTRWVLEKDPSTEVGSALQKLIARADIALRRVVDEHAGTPWAHLAALELTEPMGWKWTERP